MDDSARQDGLREDGHRFGEYEVMRDAHGGAWLLGSGSYGRTYKARHLLLGTEVAIKVIRGELTASERTRQRFLREGRALAGLTHDHIALLRHFGRTESGRLYYAMDYCAGGTLDERVRRLGPRPPGEALEIVRQAASALAAAHAEGITHRDLKPGNLMLARNPPPLHVKVIDFGLAQASGSGAAGGKFHGTAQWASPEQLREDVLDARSDLFSLGLVLWFLLQGGAPDQGSTADVVQSRLAPGGYAGRLPQGLPTGIGELLGRLLETDPRRRPATANELLENLDALRELYPYEPAAEAGAGAGEEEPAAGALPCPAGEEEPAADALPCLAGAEAGVERYARLTRLHHDLAGEWFEAELEAGQGSRFVFVLHERHAANRGLRAKVKTNLARLWRRPVDGLPRFVLLQETESTLVAEWEGSCGGDLASWLRLRRRVELREVTGLFAGVAQVADEAAARGLPGVGLMAAQVRWQSGGGNREGAAPGAAVVFPLLLDACDLPPGERLAADASGSTLALIGPELACDRLFMLAKLIYRVVAGREAPDAAAHSSFAYIAVSALSEDGNDLLRDALGRRSPWISCMSFMRALAGAEGLSISGGGPERAQTTSGGSRRAVAVQEASGHPPAALPVARELPPSGVPPPERSHRRVETTRWKTGVRMSLGLAVLMAVAAAIAAMTMWHKPPVNGVKNPGAFKKTNQEMNSGKRSERGEGGSSNWEGAKIGDHREVDIGGGVKLALCAIPAGTFTMGSPTGETGRSSDETEHGVTLSSPYWMAETVVTQGQWQALMGNNPSEFKGDPNLPVETVSWEEAQSYVSALNTRAPLQNGWKWSLPTEAQWECACRAGTTGPYAGDLDGMAWYDRNSGSKTHPVGTKKPNAWGLYDMHGNVWQWCADWYAADYSSGSVTDPTGPSIGSGRVLRGGSWHDLGAYCRSAIRYWGAPVNRSSSLGFRVAAVPAERGQAVAGLAAGGAGARDEPSLPSANGQGDLAKSAEPMKISLEGAQVGTERTIVLTGGVKLALCGIPAGTFTMGSPPDETNRSAIETQHPVTLTKSFWLGRTAVTQAQWRAVMGTSPSRFKGDDLPVETVSWDDATEFCGKLNRLDLISTGWKFALPTEAQWEYACRAGTTGPYAGDLDEMAWYGGNSGNTTHPVATKRPNAWGLYDMHGNVWQWCADWLGAYTTDVVTDPIGPSSGSRRVGRGGCWYYFGALCRSAARGVLTPDSRGNLIGFRVAAVPSP